MDIQAAKPGLQSLITERYAYGEIRRKTVNGRRHYEGEGRFLPSVTTIISHTKTKKDQEALWNGLNQDYIDVLATDHAPHTYNEKSAPYLTSPSGGPLVQHSLSALLTCFHQKRITLEKIIEKACHNPSILFDIKHRGYIRRVFLLILL